MKARRVKGIDPAAPLDDGVARVVRVRLDELCSFMPQASDPEEVEAVHDLRIAAKRLRYLLELVAPRFGAYAGTAARRVRALQDITGRIHDCDELLPRLEADPGLAPLAAELRVRRAACFAEFLAQWTDLERKGFRARLEYALTERGTMPGRSHDGNTAPGPAAVRSEVPRA